MTILAQVFGLILSNLVEFDYLRILVADLRILVADTGVVLSENNANL